MTRRTLTRPLLLVLVLCVVLCVVLGVATAVLLSPATGAGGAPSRSGSGAEELWWMPADALSPTP